MTFKLAVRRVDRGASVSGRPARVFSSANPAPPSGARSPRPAPPARPPDPGRSRPRRVATAAVVEAGEQEELEQPCVRAIWPVTITPAATVTAGEPFRVEIPAVKCGEFLRFSIRTTPDSSCEAESSRNQRGIDYYRYVCNVPYPEAGDTGPDHGFVTARLLEGSVTVVTLPPHTFQISYPSPPVPFEPPAPSP